jgi:hypothetical protein
MGRPRELGTLGGLVETRRVIAWFSPNLPYAGCQRGKRCLGGGNYIQAGGSGWEAAPGRCRWPVFRARG